MENFTLFGIFLEGLLSFLSPCVLPLLPLYMSYLAGEDKTIDEEGKASYKTGKVFITTLFFVLGISLTFALLSLSVNFLKSYIESYKEVISIIGGTLLVIFGLHDTGLIHIDILDKQLKPKLDLKLQHMNFFKAFLLGFVFSLGWSPCIGPMLSNAILMASTSASGYLYIVLYGLGLVIPFLITGLLTSKILNFFAEKKKLMKWVMIVAGVIMICFGSYMIYEAAKNINSYKNLGSVAQGQEEEDLSSMSAEELEAYVCSYDFHDQDGKLVHLEDYKGKYLMLNFTATWCTYCVQEIPDYYEFSKNEEVECLYVMSPLVSNEENVDGIKAFLEEKDIKLKTIIDEECILFTYCGIQSFPTTFILNEDGHFVCYTSGMMGVESFESFLQYAKDMQ